MIWIIGFALVTATMQFEVGMTNTSSGIKRVEITKPRSDERLYRGLEMSNGLRMVLISDPKADKCAAALNTGVGSMMEGKPYHGLAHLVEHMIFMGSKKYPDYDIFHKFMEHHGGQTNAFTAHDITVYTFDIAPKYFNGALDIFMNAFISPLFTESAVDSEVDAVCQEHEKNLGNDGWRMEEMLRSCMPDDHPLNNFFTGNRETLEELPRENNVTTQQLVRDFYEKWYSANRYSVILYSNQSLDKMENDIIPLVEQIPNRHLILEPVTMDPIKEKKMVRKVVPVKEEYRLVIMYAVPEMIKEYKSMALGIVQTLMNYEGKGSLRDALEKRGWATNLALVSQLEYPGFALATFRVHLTKAGSDNWEEVVRLWNQYLNMFRKPLEKWRLDELKVLFQIKFDSTDKRNPFSYVEHMAAKIRMCELEDILTVDAVMMETKPELVESIIDSLRPDRAVYIITDKRFANGTSLERERWYGIDYSVENIDENTIKTWADNSTNIEFLLRPKNEFVPSNLDLINSTQTENDPPQKIMENDIMSFWYKEDSVYKLPKSALIMYFRSYEVYLNAELSNTLLIYAGICMSALGRNGSQLADAGYNVIISESREGLRIDVVGFSDKLDEVADIVLDHLLNLSYTEIEFTSYRDKRLRNLKNSRKQSQRYQCAVEHSTMLGRIRFSDDELLENMANLTYQRFQELTKRLFTRVHIQAVLFGNVNREDATKQANSIYDKFIQTNTDIKPMPENFKELFSEIDLPANKSFLRTVYNYALPSVGVLVQSAMFPLKLPEEMYARLFVEIFENDAFIVLRTDEQLGYAVRMFFEKYYQSYSVGVYVTSSFTAEYVRYRIQEFMRGISAKIETMDNKTFEMHRESLASRISEKPKRIHEQADDYFRILQRREPRFDERERRLEALQNVTLPILIEYYKNYLHPDSEQLRQITIFVKPHHSVSFDNFVAKDVELVVNGEQKDISEIVNSTRNEIVVENIDAWIKEQKRLPLKFPGDIYSL